MISLNARAWYPNLSRVVVIMLYLTQIFASFLGATCPEERYRACLCNENTA